MKYEFIVPKIPLFDAIKAEANMKRITMSGINDMVSTISTNIFFEAPVGATSRLRNSIKNEVDIKGDDIIGKVFTGVAYDIVIEKGRRAAPVAKSANLITWIRRSTKGQAYFTALKAKYPKITLQGADYLLRRSLKEKPRPENPFFERGKEKSIPAIEKISAGLMEKYKKGLTA